MNDDLVKAVPISVVMKQRPVLASNNIIYNRQDQKDGKGMASWKTVRTV